MTQNAGVMTLNPETLCGIDAFRSLPADDRKTLVAHCRGRRYAADQEIITYHDRTRDVFFVVSGQVRATIYSLSGRQVTFQDLGPGGMFGELAAIDGEPRSAHVVAMTDALVVAMSPKDFWQALRSYPPVAEVTLKRLTGLVRMLCERVFEVCALPVKDRVHVELLRLALQHLRDDDTAVIAPVPTHADIASRIGTHREAVTRELNRLKNAGLIERRGNKLVVGSVSRLTRMVHEVLGTSIRST